MCGGGISVEGTVTKRGRETERERGLEREKREYTIIILFLVMVF